MCSSLVCSPLPLRLALNYAGYLSELNPRTRLDPRQYFEVQVPPVRATFHQTNMLSL